MDRIGFFTDIHGNLPALHAVLEELGGRGCDRLIHGGDAVGIGPYPAEVVETLIENDVVCVMGNHDALAAFGLPAPRPTWMSEGEAQHQEWTRSQIPERLRETIASWPGVSEELCELRCSGVFSGPRARRSRV